MKFASYNSVARVPSVLPLLGVSMLPAVLVLALVCFTLGGEAQSVRLPSGVARPPSAVERPVISARLSRQGEVTLAGQAIADEALPAAWQRERAALRQRGFRPGQAAVVIHAPPDLPTDKVQRLMEAAVEAGFTNCLLRGETKP